MSIHTLKTSQNDGSLKILKFSYLFSSRSSFKNLFPHTLIKISAIVVRVLTLCVSGFISGLFFSADSKRRRVKHFILGTWTLLASVLQRRPECLLTALTLDLLQPQTPGRYKPHVSLAVSWQGEPLGRSAQTGISRAVVLTHSLLRWLLIYFKIVVPLLLTSSDRFILFCIHCRLQWIKNVYNITML